ncbi:MAG: DUF4292 domain-containing protein [Bacteroidia bacterium]|nr:DUF4292 domain-containing protein [Bacteroidia bacterium]
MNKYKPYPFLTIIRRTVFLLVVVFTFSSCTTKKKIIKDAKSININPSLLPKDDSKTATQLAKLIKQREFTFKFLSAKIGTEVNINNEKNSFTSNVRIKKDSIIWVSISPALGIEAIRAVLTKDSVLVMDRINQKYFSGNYSYLNKLLNTEIDYDMIQSLLVGNAIDYYEDERLAVSVDIANKLYILSSIKKRKLKRVLKDAVTPTDPIESLWIIPEKYRVSKIYLDDAVNNRTFQVTFDSFQLIDSAGVIPTKSNYEIRANKSFFIDLDYTKIALNDNLEFPFRIPEKYTPMKQEDEKK